MSPTEKGALLIEYADNQVPVRGMDFGGADLHFVGLKGVGSWRAYEELEWYAQESYGYVSEGALELNYANLDGVRLDHADLSWRHCREVSLVGADLSSARLAGAYLVGANLTAADLSGADLTGSSVDGACFLDANLDGAEIWGMVADHRTIASSHWSATTVRALLNRGLTIADWADLPQELREQIVGSADGLSLYFNTRLAPFDRYIVDGVIFGTLGRDTDCRVVEFREQGETAIVRLQTSRREDLELVAEVLYRRVWEQQERAARAALPAATAAVGGNVEGSIVAVGQGITVNVNVDAEALVRMDSFVAVQKLGTELTRLRDEMRKMELRVAVAEGKPAEVVRTWEDQPGDDEN